MLRLETSHLMLRRSIPQIEEDIQPLLIKIRAEISEQLCWRNILLPVAHQVLCDVVKEPRNTFFKACTLVGVGYILYLLVRGIFAGIEVDNDTSFATLFSKNKDTRLQAGLNLTNGDQAGQFIIDALVVSVVCFHIFFRKSYYKLAGEVINECYKPHLNKLLKSYLDNLDDLSEPVNPRLIIKSKEDIDRLYRHLEKDLKPYGQEPTYYAKPLKASLGLEIV